jgi:hypothetical protein
VSEGELICDDCGLSAAVLYDDATSGPFEMIRSRCDVCRRVWRRGKRAIESNPFYVTDLTYLTEPTNYCAECGSLWRIAHVCPAAPFWNPAAEPSHD